MKMNDVHAEYSIRDVLLRIAEALERLTPPARSSGLEKIAEGYLWSATETRLKPVTRISRIDIELLKRVDSQRETLLDNTRRFALGEPANNALLWGARHRQIILGQGGPCRRESGVRQSGYSGRAN
jgi:predicted AAA+ superfamily ATPase